MAAAKARNATLKPDLPMATPSARRTPNQSKAHFEVVDPRWLLKALGVTLALGALCAYLAVCLLVYQGSWQFLLHPSPIVDKTPSVFFQPLRFDAAETGQPRLSGWWMPTDSPSAPTVLFLHDGSGSLSSAVTAIQLLHQANLNIFAIDYRGFGQSAGPHPTEARMVEDAAAALGYLVETRHIPPSSIIPYGVGLEPESLAADLAGSHPDLPALVIEDPAPGSYEAAIDDPRTQLLPMRLLMRERFDVGAALAKVKQPKLLLDDAGGQATESLFRAAPDPKFTVTFPGHHPDQAYLGALRRFLDQYIAQPVPVLKGAP